MKVVIASEFAGFGLKTAVLQHLKEEGHEVLDVGQQLAEEKVLYPQAAAALAAVIQKGDYAKGILICGSGAGVGIVANKFKGVYAVPCESIFTADGICLVNNANVITMGGNVVGSKNAFAMVDAFLNGSFAKNCDSARADFLAGMLAMVKKIEDKNFKK